MSTDYKAQLDELEANIEPYCWSKLVFIARELLAERDKIGRDFDSYALDMATEHEDLRRYISELETERNEAREPAALFDGDSQRLRAERDRLREGIEHLCTEEVFCYGYIDQGGACETGPTEWVAVEDIRPLLKDSNAPQTK